MFLLHACVRSCIHSGARACVRVGACLAMAPKGEAPRSSATLTSSSSKGRWSAGGVVKVAVDAGGFFVHRIIDLYGGGAAGRWRQ